MIFQHLQHEREVVGCQLAEQLLLAPSHEVAAIEGVCHMLNI